MASITLNTADVFPDGTSVSAYQTNSSELFGFPPGAAAATATASGGTATFDGLADNIAYVAHAQVSGQHRYRRFYTGVPSSSPGGGSGGAQQVFVQQTQPSVAYPCIWVVTDAGGNPTGEIRSENSGAYPAVDALGVPVALIDAIGDLIVGAGNDTAARLPTGTDGQVLTVQPDGTLAWETPAAADGGIAATLVDAKGDLLVGTAADTVGRLAVGSDGQVLVADSTVAGGVKWAAASGGGGSPVPTYHRVGATGEPAFQNGWSNKNATTDQVAEFCKHDFGLVMLRGQVTAAAGNTVAFTLPAGYRPPFTVRMPVLTNGLFGWGGVGADGTVTLLVSNTNAAQYVQLDSISFQTAPVAP